MISISILPNYPFWRPMVLGQLSGSDRQGRIVLVTTSPPPIRIVTRLLAELQTSIIARGLTLVDGDIDRFAILALIVRQTSNTAPSGAPAGRPISVMSLADSLSKPYETVRRHVLRLIASGLCQRGRGGVRISADAIDRPDYAAVLMHSHDAFVRFVDDLRLLNIEMPATRRRGDYQPAFGIAAAVDIMLTVLDTNRATHTDWGRLVIFSAVLAVNVAGYARDDVLARAFADETQMTPPDLATPVTSAATARLLGMPATTVRRYIDAMAAEGLLLQSPEGFVISEAWLNRPDSVAVSRRSLQNVARVLDRLAMLSFPFDHPRTAYVHGRPDDVARLPSERRTTASAQPR